LASLEFLVFLINVVILVKFVAFVPRRSFCCSVSIDELKHTKLSDKALAPKAAVGDGLRKDVDNAEEGAPRLDWASATDIVIIDIFLLISLWIPYSYSPLFTIL
jgi:hypothetical protein